jgi:hypothetical protein
LIVDSERRLSGWFNRPLPQAVLTGVSIQP